MMKDWLDYFTGETLVRRMAYRAYMLVLLIPCAVLIAFCAVMEEMGSWPRFFLNGTAMTDQYVKEVKERRT